MTYSVVGYYRRPVVLLHERYPLVLRRHHAFLGVDILASIRSSHCSMALFVDNYMCGFCSSHRRSSLWILIPVCQHNRFSSTRGQELGIRIVRCIHRPWFTNTSMCHGMTMLLVRGHMKIWRGWLLCSSEGSRPYCEHRKLCSC